MIPCQSPDHGLCDFSCGDGLCCNCGQSKPPSYCEQAEQ